MQTTHHATHEQDSLELLHAAQNAADCVTRSRIEEQIVLTYTPMTRRLASRFHGYGIDREDLDQVADIALVKAIRRFDATRGAFEPFATATVKGELKRHVRDFGWSIKPPRRVQELHSEVIRASAEITQHDGELPTTTRLAEAMETPEADVSEALTARSCYSPSSLDMPLGVAGRTLADDLADGDEQIEHVEEKLTLLQLCSGLSEDDRQLIKLRFYDSLSQREIAQELGVSQMHVSRRLSRLMGELRHKFDHPDMLGPVKTADPNV